MSSPNNYRPIGIALAISSGLFIGSSFVVKKKGLLQSQKGHAAGQGVAYLKSPLWWIGMTMMILGELLNLGAYSFVEAIIVTPMGALSVVICAILSHFFLKEKLSLFGWIGCFQCIMGSIIIAMNAPDEQSVTTIEAFKHFFLAPWFLAYGGVVLAVALGIIFFVAPKYGTKSMIWYILVCSLFGGLSVSCTQALGACVVTTIRGDNQFKNWFIYFLLAFVVWTLLSEIYFLNKALALFNTAMVTPTYYVIFTFFTLVTSVILYRGLKSSGAKIMTMVLAFFVICSGIFVLQMSKVNPKNLNQAVVDRKTSLLLETARQEVHVDIEKQEGEDDVTHEENRLVRATEEPGLDGVRATLGLGAIGSIVRSRRRQSIRQRAESIRSTQSLAHFRSRTSNTFAENEKHCQSPKQLVDAEVASPLSERRTPRVAGTSESAPSQQSYFPPASTTNAHRDSTNLNTSAFAPQVPDIKPHTPLTFPTPIQENRY